MLKEDIIDLIKNIDCVIDKIQDFLNSEYSHGLRYSHYLANEVDNDVYEINLKVAKLNPRLEWAEPTHELNMLRDKLAYRYDLLYEMIDKLDSAVRNSNL